MLNFDGQIAGEYARRVDRVLDVRQGELCWVAGTIYMDMPLKPNILDDLTRDVREPSILLYPDTDSGRTSPWPLHLAGRIRILQIRR